jgi:hypothetical protein
MSGTRSEIRFRDERDFENRSWLKRQEVGILDYFLTLPTGSRDQVAMGMTGLNPVPEPWFEPNAVRCGTVTSLRQA